MAFPADVCRTVHESMMPRHFLLVRLRFSAAGYAHSQPALALRSTLFVFIVLLVVQVEYGSSLQRLALSVCYFLHRMFEYGISIGYSCGR